MSYKINSPVKQVWLPIDYDWLYEVIGDTNTFGNFSKAYKERYGIDLYDLFKLSINEINFSFGLKIGLIGTYFVNEEITEYAIINGVVLYTTGETQSDSIVSLACIFCGDNTISYGFNIYLPVQGTPVNSIDDLEVKFYEL